MAAGETTSGPAVAAAGAAANDGAAAPESADAIMDPGARMAAMLAEGVDLDDSGAAPAGATFAGDAARAEATETPEPGTDQVDAVAPVQNDAVLRAGFRKLEGEKQKLLEARAEAERAKTEGGAHAEKAKAHDDLLAGLSNDPAATLLALGGEALVDKVIDAIADLSKPSAEREVAKLRRELKAKNEAEEKARVEAEQNANVERWRKGITDEITAGGEKYDLVNALGHHAVVIEMITQHYAATKQTMSTAQAAAKLEALLEGNVTKSKKFGSRVTQAAATTPKPQPAPGSAPRTAPKQTGATTLAAVHASEVPGDDAGEIAEMDPGKRFDAVMASLGN